VVFPFLNQKLDFSGEQAAHVVIHTHLDAILTSIRAAQADHSKFDPPALKAAMEEFKVPLVGVVSRFGGEEAWLTIYFSRSSHTWTRKLCTSGLQTWGCSTTHRCSRSTRTWTR
jgi:hypothetical protein